MNLILPPLAMPMLPLLPSPKDAHVIINHILGQLHHLRQLSQRHLHFPTLHFGQQLLLLLSKPPIIPIVLICEALASIATLPRPYYLGPDVFLSSAAYSHSSYEAALPWQTVSARTSPGYYDQHSPGCIYPAPSLSILTRLPKASLPSLVLIPAKARPCILYSFLKPIQLRVRVGSMDEVHTEAHDGTDHDTPDPDYPECLNILSRAPERKPLRNSKIFPGSSRPTRITLVLPSRICLGYRCHDSRQSGKLIAISLPPAASSQPCISIDRHKL